MSNFTQVSSRTNLVAHSLTIPETNTYYIQGTMQLPSADPSVTQGPGGGAGTGSGGGPRIPSQVVMTIRQNGSVVLTSQPGASGFILANLPCTAGDIITFTPTSSLAQDNQLNAIRMTLAVSEGSI